VSAVTPHDCTAVPRPDLDIAADTGGQGVALYNIPTRRCAGGSRVMAHIVNIQALREFRWISRRAAAGIAAHREINDIENGWLKIHPGLLAAAWVSY
jgi:hypothetical protein